MIKTVMKPGVVITLLGLLCSLFSCTTAPKADLPALMKNGALVIDVRTPGEFAGGAVKGAVNIPYDEIAGQISRIESDKNRSIIVYCQSGARSAVAQRTLARAGYTQVVNAGSFSNVRKILDR